MNNNFVLIYIFQQMFLESSHYECSLFYYESFQNFSVFWNVYHNSMKCKFKNSRENYIFCRIKTVDSNNLNDSVSTDHFVLQEFGGTTICITCLYYWYRKHIIESCTINLLQKTVSQFLHFLAKPSDPMMQRRIAYLCNKFREKSCYFITIN